MIWQALHGLLTISQSEGKVHEHIFATAALAL